MFRLSHSEWLRLKLKTGSSSPHTVYFFLQAFQDGLKRDVRAAAASQVHIALYCGDCECLDNDRLVVRPLTQQKAPPSFQEAKTPLVAD
jgi:hypothetical protein